MARPKKQKDPFEGCPPEFRDAVNAATDDEVNAKIAEVAKNDAALRDAKAEDEDLAQAKARAQEAGLIYRDGQKCNRACIGYARAILAARGKPAGESGTQS